MNVVGATYTAGTVISWELARAPWSHSQRRANPPLTCWPMVTAFSDFAVTPHAGLPVLFVATKYAGVLRAVDVRPALVTL